jgi:hypothetical protein
MESKVSKNFQVGYFHNGDNKGTFRIPCLVELDYNARKANFYFNVRKLTKNEYPYSLEISDQQLANKGYATSFENIPLYSNLRKRLKKTIRDLARTRGKKILEKLLSDGLIK